jgi:hypothetical protein
VLNLVVCFVCNLFPSGLPSFGAFDF